MNKRVQITGINTSNLEVIPEKLKMDLIKKSHAGDKYARDKLIEGNLKLVLRIVQKFSGKSESVDDLFQIGTIGLIKAVDNFDISHNTKFSTYAVPMIIGEIRRYIRDNSPVRVSRSMKEIAYKSIQIREKIFNETGKDPSLDEIAEKLHVSKESIAISLESIADPVSLEEPIGGDDENLSLMDQISNEGNEFWTDQIMINDRIKNLSKKEKMILSMRFIKGLTQTKVATSLNISQAQVSRIEKNAIKKIKCFE